MSFIGQGPSKQDCYTVMKSVTERRNPITTNIDVASPLGMSFYLLDKYIKIESSHVL